MFALDPSVPHQNQHATLLWTPHSCISSFLRGAQRGGQSRAGRLERTFFCLHSSDALVQSGSMCEVSSRANALSSRQSLENAEALVEPELAAELAGAAWPTGGSKTHLWPFGLEESIFQVHMPPLPAGPGMATNRTALKQLAFSGSRRLGTAWRAAPMKLKEV